MKRTALDISECADEINAHLKQGVFLTTKAGNRTNTMVIGWGHVGRIWERPVFAAYVRRSRFTRELLDQNPEFTVNVPVNGFEPDAFAVCGSKSGRDMDKFAVTGLTLTEPEVISVPGILEYPLTLECRVIYRQEQDLSLIPEDIRERFYQDGDSHVMYFGEIKACYRMEE